MTPTQASSNANEVGSKILIGVFLTVGVLILLADGMACIGRWRWVQTAASAPGIVTRLNAGGSHPEVQFTTDTGKIVHYPQGGLISGYTAGGRVTVLYDRSNPRDASLAAWGALWGFHAGGVLMGLAFVGMAVLKLKRPDLVT